MFKITGLEELNRNFRDAQTALAGLDGDLTSVSFDPADPASIEAAIVQMEQAIDERVGPYADNPIVAPLAQDTKERFRQAILDRAAAARSAIGEV